MKRIVLIILVFAVVLTSSFAFADKHIFAHYTVFVDGEFYNSFFNAGFKFDTQMYDFYLYDDFSGGLFYKEEWYKGNRTSSGLIDVTYTSTGSGNFRLNFGDGSFINGYWDPDNDEDLWICLSGKTYFRFTPVHSFDIQKDMVEK